MDTLIYPYNKTMYIYSNITIFTICYPLLISILYYVYAINPSYIIVYYTYCIIL